MAGEVNLTVSLNKSHYPALGTNQAAYVYIEAVPAANLPIASGSVPLNLAFVLDRSGSMAGKPIQDLKQAAKMAVDRLSPQDLVSIVIFDEHADIVAPTQPAADKASLMAQIDRINERGGTKMSVGMQQGLNQLQQGLGAGRVNRMILLTDGETWEDQEQCQQLAHQAGQMGVPITALGLGEEWNLQLLTNLASASGGTYEYVDAPEKIIATFQGIVSAMQGAVAANAHMTLRLVSGVHPKAVWRVTPLIERLGHRALSERDVQVSLGDLLQKGQSVLVELTFPPRQVGTYRMAQAEVSYDIPGSGARNEKSQVEVMVNFVSEQGGAEIVNGRVMNIIEKVTAFKLQTQALDEAAAGNIANATQKLRAAATRLLNLGELEMAQEAQAAANQMAVGEQLSPKATKKLHAATRKLDMSDLGT
jgi:Ca-activated chloride channel homolog